MKALKIVLAVVAVVVIAAAAAAPIGPMPGFFIGGNETPAPAEWPDTSTVDEITLKVPGALPRVVIIWVVEHNGDLHVAGARDSGWTAMLGGGGPVEMRLGDNTYALNATPVTEGMAEVLAAWIAKYEPNYPDIVADFPAPEEAGECVAVYRLERG